MKGWVYGLGLSPDAETLAGLRSERRSSSIRVGIIGVKLWSAAGEMKKDSRQGLRQASDRRGRVFAGRQDAGPSPGRPAASPDGMSGKVTLVDPATGTVRKELTPGHLNGLTDIASTLPTARRARLLRPRHHGPHLGRRIGESSSRRFGKDRGGLQFKDWIHAVAYSPDGRWLAAADMAGSVHIYALAGGVKDEKSTK